MARPRGAPKADVSGFLVHSAPENIEPIVEHVATLHQELLSCTVAEPERALDLIARFAWWMSHAMPYERGSQGIVEWYVDAMIKRFDLPLGVRRYPMDLSAFRLSEVEYAQAFAEHFDRAEARVPVEV